MFFLARIDSNRSICWKCQPGSTTNLHYLIIQCSIKNNFSSARSSIRRVNAFPRDNPLTLKVRELRSQKQSNWQILVHYVIFCNLYVVIFISFVYWNGNSEKCTWSPKDSAEHWLGIADLAYSNLLAFFPLRGNTLIIP